MQIYDDKLCRPKKKAVLSLTAPLVINCIPIDCFFEIIYFSDTLFWAPKQMIFFCVNQQILFKVIQRSSEFRLTFFNNLDLIWYIFWGDSLIMTLTDFDESPAKVNLSN